MNGDVSRAVEELRKNPALLQQIMNSRDGQELLRMLSGNGFERAAESAAKGDGNEMAQRIRQVMQTPEGAALLERIRKSLGA